MNKEGQKWPSYSFYIYYNMSEISYYTEEGYKALKDEVHHLISVERPKISAQIGEAIDKGDLSENGIVLEFIRRIRACVQIALPDNTWGS